jgi:quercetin dioxygenase-like cupin family protein
VARAGAVIENVVIGDRVVFRRTTAETGGALLEFDMFVRAGAPGPPEHIHPQSEERFQVLRGTLRARVAGTERTVAAGESLTVAAGTLHTWWNVGTEEVAVRVQLTPAGRMETFLETIYALAGAGRTNRKGIPHFLQLAVFALFFLSSRGERVPMKLRVVLAMRISFAIVALACLLARTASGQSPAHPSASVSPVGTWRGTSVCLVRPSACNDEIVVYRITPMKTADSVSVDALKIVRGEEQDMGVLSCSLVARGGQLACAIPHGTWRFLARNDSLTGELRLPDNTRFREVRAVRAP